MVTMGILLVASAGQNGFTPAMTNTTQNGPEPLSNSPFQIPAELSERIIAVGNDLHDAVSQLTQEGADWAGQMMDLATTMMEHDPCA
jgi:hypothetical protein